MERRVTASELSLQSSEASRRTEARPIAEWLRSGATLGDVRRLVPADLDTDSELAGEIVEDVVYAPYVERQDAELRDLRASEGVTLPANFPYENVPGLSNEMVERLSRARPNTLAAAGRVRGITPAALAALLVHARRRDQQAI